MDTLKKKKNPWVCYETEVPHSRVCDPASGVSPAEKLSPEHLQILRNAFTCPKAKGQIRENRPHRGSGRNRGEDEERGLNLKEFCEVLRSVIGPDIEDKWVERFFSEVDITCTGQVKWQQLCSYLLLEYSERERASVPRAALLDSQPLIRHCSHNKREPTVRVVAVSHPPPLRYISVSKGGQITVWNSSLHILKSLGLAGDPTEEVASTRRFRGWTTDAVSMGNVHKVAIVTDCRDLHFVNFSTAGVYEDYHLFGFRSVMTALCYWYDIQCPEQPSLLLMGDEKGGVHLLWFLRPSKGLFNNSYKRENGPQRIFFPDLGQHSNMVSYRHNPNTHQGSINRVMFDPGTNTIMTSSESDTSSVVFTNVALKQEPYIWKFKQGSKCFDYNASLQLIVTGGCDRTVRLWTQFVTTRPLATLLGHRASVLDVAIYQPAGQIFSYSRDAELRIWDISSHQCLKTVTVQFPCQKPGRISEHGNFPFLLLSPPLTEQYHLMVGCKDYLALLNLAETRRGGGRWLMDGGKDPGPNTESGVALSCVLYNSTLKQVVTGHADSSVSLWDVETGRRRLQILNVHGEDVLTCMALDSSHRRLITGARNGTIKVWNLLNGLNLHKLEPVTDSKITGLTCLRDNQLLAVGWSQRIVQYDIAAAKAALEWYSVGVEFQTQTAVKALEHRHWCPCQYSVGSCAHAPLQRCEILKDLYVRADMSWKSRGVHKSDILAVSQCIALGLVATASHDGEVVIWRLETQGPMLHLQMPVQRGVVPPVDSLLFLHYRAGNRKLRHRGVLVASHAGCLSFWSVTGQMHSYGQFYAPEQAGERVLSLTSDQHKNTILVSGDTAGWVQMWEIDHFGMEMQNKPVCERPPMLQSWKAHLRALVSVEVLKVADRLFVLTASADGSAGLWTKDGDHVGCFGQEVMWNITEPATYQRNMQKKLTEEERTKSDGMGVSSVKSEVIHLTNKGQTSQEECCSEGNHSAQTVSSTRPSENNQERPQQPMYLLEDFCQTVASCHERSHLFNDIHHSNHC